ncbi:hypothetical protein BIY23_02760 [Wolbachia pipientis]|uniref:Msp4/OMP-like domain-containing protein n=1 Tax=Wolbachia pipientis TaxID=955 RepID=A0A1E7QJG6_WOLPI|nr:hypothetical protein BIY23_02760 [Wolbachia pipientis]
MGYHNLNASIERVTLDVDQRVADLRSNVSGISEDLSSATQFREELPVSSKIKLHHKNHFYVSFSGGKTYDDNSEVFVNGIRAIGDRMLTLIDGNSWSSIIKNILTGEINAISQFDGKINFQWLGHTSLGCHIGENGRIDYEIINFKMSIQDNKLIFDKSASIFAFLFNLYYSPHIKDTKLSPYISFGIGPTIFRLQRINKPTNTIVPLNLPWYAYQVRLGIDYVVVQDLSVFLGYRYFNIPIPLANRISTHNIEAGIRLHF